MLQLALLTQSLFDSWGSFKNGRLESLIVIDDADIRELVCAKHHGNSTPICYHILKARLTDRLMKWVTSSNKQSLLKKVPAPSGSTGGNDGGGDATISVDETQAYQTIDGFGASLSEFVVFNKITRS